MECHLALALIKRYVMGEDLVDSVIDDLQKHLAACPSCMSVAKGESKPFASPKIDWSIMLGVFRNPKNLTMLAVLGLVLVGMGTVLRNPTALLGPKASASTPAPVDSKKLDTTPVPKPEVVNTPAVQATEEKPPKPVETAAKTPPNDSQTALTEEVSSPNVAIAGNAFRQAPDDVEKPIDDASKTLAPSSSRSVQQPATKPEPLASSDLPAGTGEPPSQAKELPLIHSDNPVVQVEEHPNRNRSGRTTTHSRAKQLTSGKITANSKPKSKKVAKSAVNLHSRSRLKSESASTPSAVPKAGKAHSETSVLKSGLKAKRPSKRVQKASSQSNGSGVEIFDPSGRPMNG